MSSVVPVHRGTPLGFPGPLGLHRQLGLTDEELERILGVLGREPTRAELAMFSLMWSEHCSYKSSKVHLRRLPSQGRRVLQGPGENAGVVDLGGGVAAVFKIESHNHPSFVEPFQGAATGVGGIIRDILAMGARPAASLNSLRFGDPAEPLQRRLVEGVVAGIGHYGNCVGVATVGGEVVFDPCYAGNPLVNALTVGFMPAERRLSGSAEQPGDLAVLMGAKTGRDGIGGASVLASAGFEDGDQAKRPNVQVGDPFQEKLLIEACLELVERGLLRGLQDLGAAGISCAVAEVAARAGMGMEVDLDAVPLREPSMEAWEVLVSESQERMLALVDPARLPDVLEVCRRWGILASVLGEMTTGGSLRVRFRGEVVAEVPAASLADDGPVYSRPLVPPAPAGPPGPRSRWTRTRPRPCSPWPPTRPARPSAGCGSSTTASWATGPWPGPAPTRPCSGSPARPGRSPWPPTATAATPPSTRPPGPRWPSPRRPATWPAPAPSRSRSPTASTSPAPSGPR